MNQPEPRMYVIMRTDLESMNPGKAMAQAAHAGSKLGTAAERGELAPAVSVMYKEWQDQANGFGTTITLAATNGVADFDQIYQLLREDPDYDDFYAVKVHDPTYPVADGAVVHLLPLDTCMVVFGDANDARLCRALGRFDLHY